MRASLLGIPVIGDLVPDGSWMQRESRYALKEFGFVRLSNGCRRNSYKDGCGAELEVQFRGIQEQDGRPCYVLEFIFPNSQWRTHPYYRIVLHWDIVYRVPVNKSL